MWLHFIAGPCDQSHAHQEQGAFALFARAFLTVTENGEYVVESIDDAAMFSNGFE